MATIDNGVPIPEAAQRLGISEKTVRRRIKAGELRAYEIATIKGPAWRVVLPTQDDHRSHAVQATQEERDNEAIAAVLLYLAQALGEQERRLAEVEVRTLPVYGPPVPVVLPREVIEDTPSTQVGTVVNMVDNEAVSGLWARVRAWWRGGQ